MLDNARSCMATATSLRVVAKLLAPPRASGEQPMEHVLLAVRPNLRIESKGRAQRWSKKRSPSSATPRQLPAPEPGHDSGLGSVLG